MRLLMPCGGMDGQDLHSRRIRVNYAKEKSSRGFGGAAFRGSDGVYGNGGGHGGSGSGYGTNSYAGGN
ncbi:hypothetical protein CRG98_046642 [Punica granatum]|uniref:Uncharacterized protein n=1 Tax=Punica granatum TaxID=22663 RepID=A0A2I0HMQ4_PUNGR|nr:hypothetical protein CRG98_046642 [Punica granatum]